MWIYIYFSVLHHSKSPSWTQGECVTNLLRTQVLIDQQLYDVICVLLCWVSLQMLSHTLHNLQLSWHRTPHPGGLAGEHRSASEHQQSNVKTFFVAAIILYLSDIQPPLQWCQWGTGPEAPWRSCRGSRSGHCLVGVPGWWWEGEGGWRGIRRRTAWPQFWDISAGMKQAAGSILISAVFSHFLSCSKCLK